MSTSEVLADDETGDARSARELGDAEYDGVVIGSFISGQDPGGLCKTPLAAMLRRRAGHGGTAPLARLAMRANRMPTAPDRR